MTHFINLFAGPGAGKTTLAAGIFSELKSRDINCELVLEFAKELVWKEDIKQFENQFYLFGEQLNRYHFLIDKVDVVVTDYPIVQFLLYHNSPFTKQFSELINSIFKTQENHNYFVKRQKPYMKLGRIHSEEEASKLDEAIIDIFVSNNLPYETIPGDKKIIPDFCDKFIAKVGL